MIDLALFKFVLEERKDEGLIEHTDVLTVEAMTFLAGYGRAKVQELFRSYPCQPPPLWRWESACFVCGTVVSRTTSRTKMLEYLWLMRSKEETWQNKFFRCTACETIEKQKQQGEREKQLEVNGENRQRDAAHFIDTYLDPMKQWRQGTIYYDAFREVSREASGVENDVAEYIKAMPYGDFLSTPYWKCVAVEVYRRAGYKCSLCSASGQLNAHHRDYSIHGYEHQQVGKNLICLCQNCHETFHQERELAS